MSSEAATGQQTRQALWDLSLSAAGVGTYVLHLPGQDLDVDDRLLELSALTRDTFTGRPEDVYANVHPDDVADVVARVQHALATAGTYRAQYRISLPEGGVRWVAARGQTLTDGHGTTTALVGAAFDVTELHEAHARTATVLETMAIGYLSVDAHWVITYVNAAAEQVAQAPRSDLVGRSFWEAFPATAGTEFERSYRRAVATGTTVSFDAFYPEPLDVWVEVRAVPEGDGLALYFLDITARHDAEQALDAAAVRQRESAQAQSELVQVARALGEASTETDVLGVVTHAAVKIWGIHGSALSLPDAGGASVRSLSASYTDQVLATFDSLPADHPLPAVRTAVTGVPHHLPDLAALTAQFPGCEDIYAAGGIQSSAAVPLRARGVLLGSFSLGFAEPHTWTEEEQDLLVAFAALTAQALDRISARDAERDAALQALAAAQAERVSAQRQATLVAIAQALADADTQEALLDVLGAKGVALLEANGCGLCLREPDGAHVTTFITDSYAEVRHAVQRVPADFPLPAIRSAATGQAIYLPDREQTEAAFPGSAAVYAGAGVQASAAVPLHGRTQLWGCLSVGFARARTWTEQERELLRAFAALTAQALDRLAAHDAEQAALAETASIAETLQRSMLTAPPEPDHLQIVVRYTAAAKAAEVGGDWYDAFITSDGLTSLVIGDVTGHDMGAAAVMGQLRNLLRGIAFTLGEPPAKVLAALDRAAAGLGIDTVATAVVAQIEVDAAHRAAGTRLLRWSNAGHLPPLLITAEGAASYLQPDEADLVLGWDPATDRRDHEAVLAPGSTVLLYTDGLVERRGVGVDVGLAWLAQAAADLVVAPGSTLDDLCDGLLALVGGHLDDDVALLALRAHPEDEPRPAEAGPVRVPEGLDAARAAAPSDGPL
ncbi:SpoIIE family protein phosphatase [Quadrisphaera sp. INWT6]|uniref:SpoIIE family protein phosphatase n=1 Tax=Quadrisphaera sp. INWT6 TaxID=2596917 RepID=UPI0018925AE7|nr:SpoIIE family protein phosphatase [Quadrisphaera sp. INWT6]